MFADVYGYVVGPVWEMEGIQKFCVGKIPNGGLEVSEVFLFFRSERKLGCARPRFQFRALASPSGRLIFSFITTSFSA